MHISVSSWIKYVLFITVCVCGFSACMLSNEKPYTSWNRGDGGSNAYSRLNQVNKETMNPLKVAWEYHTRDKSDNFSLECCPIIVHDILYAVSPMLKPFAVDAKTGKELWVFNPFDKNSKNGGVSRGPTCWEDKNEQRIFLFAANKLIALDAKQVYK